MASSSRLPAFCWWSLGHFTAAVLGLFFVMFVLTDFSMSGNSNDVACLTSYFVFFLISFDLLKHVEVFLSNVCLCSVVFSIVFIVLDKTWWVHLRLPCNLGMSQRSGTSVLGGINPDESEDCLCLTWREIWQQLSLLCFCIWGWIVWSSCCEVEKCTFSMSLDNVFG